MRFSKSQMQVAAEAQRLPASQELAESLLERFAQRLRDWDLNTLTHFVAGRTLSAESFGLVSKADVYAFVETTLLLAPSLENTRQFREAAANAPKPSGKMLHVLQELPPGFLAQLTVSDAPKVWHRHYMKATVQ